MRALNLAGLGVEEGRALLGDKRLDGDEPAWRALVERCAGNGLALKVVAETVRDLFGGSIAAYLEYARPGVQVGGVRELVGAQIRRLSAPEWEVLRWLAAEREPVGFAEMASELSPRLGHGSMLEAVEGLRRRSLLERTDRGATFGLHSVVLEYVTEQIVEDLAEDVAAGEPLRLRERPPAKATTEDYVGRSQERSLVAPLVERLIAACGSAEAAERRLAALLG